MSAHLQHLAGLDFDARMAARAKRRSRPEYLERIEAIKRRRRLKEIWAAIHAYDFAEAHRRMFNQLPFSVRAATGRTAL